MATISSSPFVSATNNLLDSLSPNLRTSPFQSAASSSDAAETTTPEAASVGGTVTQLTIPTQEQTTTTTTSSDSSRSVGSGYRTASTANTYSAVPSQTASAASETNNVFTPQKAYADEITSYAPEDAEGEQGESATTSLEGYYTPEELFENIYNPYGISEGSQYESLLQKALEEYYLANSDEILGGEEAPTFSEYTRERYGTPIYAQTPVYENAPYPDFYFSQDEIGNMSQEDIDSLVAALIDNAKEQTVNPDDIFISGAYNPNMASLALDNGAYTAAAYEDLLSDEEKALRQAEADAAEEERISQLDQGNAVEEGYDAFARMKEEGILPFENDYDSFSDFQFNGTREDWRSWVEANQEHYVPYYPEFWPEGVYTDEGFNEFFDYNENLYLYDYIASVDEGDFLPIFNVVGLDGQDIYDLAQDAVLYGLIFPTNDTSEIYSLLTAESLTSEEETRLGTLLSQAVDDMAALIFEESLREYTNYMTDLSEADPEAYAALNQNILTTEDYKAVQPNLENFIYVNGADEFYNPNTDEEQLADEATLRDWLGEAGLILQPLTDWGKGVSYETARDQEPYNYNYDYEEWWGVPWTSTLDYMNQLQSLPDSAYSNAWWYNYDNLYKEVLGMVGDEDEDEEEVE